MNPHVLSLKSREEQDRIRMIQRRHEKWLHGRAKTQDSGTEKPEYQPNQVEERDTISSQDERKTAVQSSQVPESLEKNKGSTIGNGNTLLNAQMMSSHCCPMCFELMKNLERTPMLVIPCGHTFCAKCLDIENSRPQGKICPYCQSNISSAVVNQSLKSLIESFVENCNGITSERGCGTQRFHHASKSLQYRDELNALEVRMKILANKKTEAEICTHKAIERARALGKAKTALENEENRIKNRLQLLQDELALVQKHIYEQGQKFKAACEEASKHEKNVGLLDGTILTIQQQREKISILLQSKDIASI